MLSGHRAAYCAPMGSQPANTIPDSIKAAEHQQRPCDPVHKSEPYSHDFLSENVDKPQEQDKPCQRTEKDADNEHQAESRMAHNVLDSEECKRRRKSEERQRIGKHKKSRGEKGPRVAMRRLHGLVREWMDAEGAISNSEQDDPASEANPVLFEGNEVRDERDPEGRDDAVDHITACSAHPDHKAVPRTVFQRTPDAKDANRSNRRRERKPNNITLYKIHEIHAIGSSDISRIPACSLTRS